MVRPRLIIFVLALTAFAPILRVGFLWDDHVMIENNPQIQSWSLSALRSDFSSDMFRGQGDPYFRPLQVLSNRIDYTLWGLRPWGHHLTQLFIHAANALLFYELLIALGASVLVGLAAGSLFAVHPIIVEEMMIIAGRGEILSLAFILASLLCFIRSVRPKLPAIAGGYLFYACALLTKESAVGTPLLLALLLALQKRPKRDYGHVIGLTLLTLPYLLLRRHAVGSLPLPPLELSLRFFTLAFPNVLLTYTRLLFFPWNLHSHRLMPHLSHAWPLYLILISGFLAWPIYRKKPLILAGAAWFVLCLLPKTPVMMVGNFMLDHWIYPSSLAFFTGAGWLIIRGWNSSNRWIRQGAASMYGFALIALALMAHVNVELRKTDEKMYRWALYFTTSNPIKYNLGILLAQSGRANEALPYLEEVCHAYPDDSRNINALAMAYTFSGYPKTALILLERQHQKFPQDTQTLRNLAHLRTMMARPR